VVEVVAQDGSLVRTVEGGEGTSGRRHLSGLEKPQPDPGLLRTGRPHKEVERDVAQAEGASDDGAPSPGAQPAPRIEEHRGRWIAQTLLLAQLRGDRRRSHPSRGAEDADAVRVLGPPGRQQAGARPAASKGGGGEGEGGRRGRRAEAAGGGGSGWG